MADFYCDYLNGDDSTGDGSIGNPYKTIGKVFSLTSGVSASGGNHVYVADTAAQVLSSPITFDAHWTGNTDEGKPCLVAPYHVSGGDDITIDFPSGLSITAFEVDGDDAVASVWSPPRGFFIYGAHLHTSTSFVVDPGETRTGLLFCKIEDGGGVALVDGSIGAIIGCWFLGAASPTGQDALENALMVNGCYIDGMSGRGIGDTSNYGVITGNVIRNCEEQGFNPTNDDLVAVMRNTFIGDGTNNQVGFLSDGAASMVIDNIFHGFSGTGASGIGENGNAADNPLIAASNSFYDCTTNIDATPMMDADNDTESSDPLTDEANEDFSIVTTADAYHAAETNVGTSRGMRGAEQKDNDAGGGGGGGGETAHVFAC